MVSTFGVSLACGVAALCLLSWLYTRLFARGFHVANSHVLITGGSSGLGLALARKYARAGAKVSIVARDTNKLAAAKHEIEAASSSTHGVFTFACDVTDYESVQQAVAKANAFHKRVTDHVICNAGMSKPALFVDQDVTDFHKLMEINYFGAVHTAKAALPAMIDTRLDARDKATRRIVFISSAAALTTFAGLTQYSGSKYAVRGLSDALRNELKLYDIETSIFFPGNIDTPQFVEEELIKPAVTKALDGASSASPPDAAAQALLDGLARGQYAITNELQFEVLRALTNGVAPRTNSPLEAILLPLYVVVQTVFLWYFDWVVSRHKNKTKTRT